MSSSAVKHLQRYVLSSLYPLLRYDIVNFKVAVSVSSSSPLLGDDLFGLSFYENAMSGVATHL